MTPLYNVPNVNLSPSSLPPTKEAAKGSRSRVMSAPREDAGGANEDFDDIRIEFDDRHPNPTQSALSPSPPATDSPQNGPPVVAARQRQDDETGASRESGGRLGYLTSQDADAGADRPVTPGTLEVMRRLGAENPSVFAEAVPASYQDYLTSGSAPVYGIPVDCHMPSYPPAEVTFFPSAIAPQPVPLQPTLAALPPHPGVGVELNMEEVDNLWNLARSCRIYAIADTFIVCLLLLSKIWVAALVPFPVVGFIGARRFSRRLLIAYMLYFPLIIGVRAYVGYFGAVDAEGAMKVVYIVMSVLGGLAELYIGHAVYTLQKLLGETSPLVVDWLRTGYNGPDGSGWSF